MSQNEGSVSLQRCVSEKSCSFIGTLVPGHLGLALNEQTILRDCVLRYMRITDVRQTKARAVYSNEWALVTWQHRTKKHTANMKLHMGQLLKGNYNCEAMTALLNNAIIFHLS